MQDSSKVRMYGPASAELEKEIKEKLPYKKMTPSEYFDLGERFDIMTFDEKKGTTIYYKDLCFYSFQDNELDAWIQAWDTLEYGFASEEDEEKIKQDYEYPKMSPEEYAARFGYDIGAFGLHRYRYRDKELEKWLSRLYLILTVDRAKIEDYRKTLLTPEELAEIEARENSCEW